MAKHMNKNFTEEETQMKNTCMKICLTSLVIKNANKSKIFFHSKRFYSKRLSITQFRRMWRIAMFIHNFWEYKSVHFWHLEICITILNLGFKFSLLLIYSVIISDICERMFII